MNHVLKKFFRDQSGNIAIMFCLSLVVLGIGAGVAVDFVRENTWQTRLQASADSSALAVASAGASGDAAVKIANDFFAQNFVAADGIGTPRVSTQVVNGEVTVTATADMKTSLMSIVGFKAVGIKAVSVAQQGKTMLEVALVLDVSGSMNAPMGAASRLAVLKKSATDLLNTISNNGTDMSKVKVSIIPFNMDVNVGTNNTAFVQGTADPLFAGQAWAGCVMERAGNDAYSDAYDGGGSSSGKWRAFAWPPEPNNRPGSCENPSDGTNKTYARIDPPNGFFVATRGPNYNCVRHPIMPLTNSYATIKSKIDGLTAEGNDGTIIAPGVGWGLRALSPTSPFTEGAAYSSSTKKVMIVLTDGEQTTEAEYGTQGQCSQAANTISNYVFVPASKGLAGKPLNGKGPEDTFSPYGYIKDSDPFGSVPMSWADVRKDLTKVSQASCDSAKAAGGNNPITVYTIAVSRDAGPGTEVNDLLQSCATSKDKFYLAADESGLTSAFNAIAEQIKEIRLTN